MGYFLNFFWNPANPAKARREKSQQAREKNGGANTYILVFVRWTFVKDGNIHS